MAGRQTTSGWFEAPVRHLASASPSPTIAAKDVSRDQVVCKKLDTYFEIVSHSVDVGFFRIVLPGVSPYQSDFGCQYIPVVDCTVLDLVTNVFDGDRLGNDLVVIAIVSFRWLLLKVADELPIST